MILQGESPELPFLMIINKPGAESPVFARCGAQKCAHKDMLLILKSDYLFNLSTVP
jgi:hypothetical protein